MLVSHLSFTVTLIPPTNTFWVLAPAYADSISPPLSFAVSSYVSVLDAALEQLRVAFSEHCMFAVFSSPVVSGALECVHVRLWQSRGQRADKHSSAAVEIRDRQMGARGWNRTLSLGCKHPSSWASIAVYSNGTMPSLAIMGMVFFGSYFLVFCFPWLFLLDQYRQKCNTMWFWH